MAESPTPTTGTPESQSPVRTPPALITTEELLESMEAKGPEEAALPPEAAPSTSVSRVTAPSMPTERYQLLRDADASHKLQLLLLPPEEDLRAAALGELPAIGPPPRLPHQLSPALQSVLVGWRSVYESCCTTDALQALVGGCYAREAVFEDAMVSARGQEAVYRQFALLGAVVRSVHVSAYSLSVAPLAQPVVALSIAAAEPEEPSTSAAAAAAALRRPGGTTTATRQAGPQPPQQDSERQVPLHLTRVAVENVQTLTVGLPYFMSRLMGLTAEGIRIPLYVTSILLVASDAPLAVAVGGFDGITATAAAEATTRRLAGAAAALLSGVASATAATSSKSRFAATDPTVPAVPAPSWRVVHHVDMWHNVPLVWWRVRRAVCRILDSVLSPWLRL
ncbi:hypothetical protein Agub_g8974 [Astrephomene gubernaculifera]|uniref:Uncharacterized protein n=1 Tax=Astrephomene gubernaculifera TaxID=47775 RepID=A0AAD3HNJ4_9CHLO|nr:hypothetical protein Agub_g8974 [Astrephomene gubernaculifera]